jgi:type I restriction enzyme S subunit
MNASKVLLDEIIVSDQSGFACSKTKLVEDGLIHLRPFNLTNDGAFSFEELYRVPLDEAPNGKRKLEAGDILFNNTNSVELVGKAALIEQSIEAGFSNHLTRIRVQQERVSPQFMSYWLRWMRGTGYFSAHATQWVSQAAFKSSELRRLTMPLPSLPEQVRIVDILYRAEGIVKLRREAQKKAAKIIPAMFIDTFGDPTTNPKGWAKMPLGNLCARITDGTHQPPKFQGSGIPFIFISNIVRGELTFDTSKFISDETYMELTRRCPIEMGDVLYSTVGSYGVPVKVDTGRRFSFQRHIAHIKPHRDKLDSDFLVGMLSTPSLKAQADAAARGIAQKTVNLGEIQKYQVIAPPLETQQSFASQVVAARSIQSQQSAATAKAETAFEALLGHTFREGTL